MNMTSKWIGKIRVGMAVLMAAVLMAVAASPAFAAEAAEETEAVHTASTVKLNADTKGTHVYVFPGCEGGLESGKVWMYVEEIDKNGEPVSTADLSVTAKLTVTPEGAEQETQEKEIPVKATSEGTGFYTGVVDIVMGELSSYELELQVEQNGRAITDRTYELESLMTPYPQLLADSLEKHYSYNEKFDLDRSQSGITVNWDDIALFRRIFSVECTADSDLPVTLAEYTGKSYLYTLEVHDLAEGQITLKLTDLLGHSYDLPYTLKVDKEGMPLVILGLFVVGAAGVILLIILVLGRAKHRRAEESGRAVKDQGGSVPVKKEDVSERLAAITGIGYPGSGKNISSAGQANMELRAAFEEESEKVLNEKLRMEKKGRELKKKMQEVGVPLTDARYQALYSAKERRELEQNFQDVREAYRTCTITGDRYDIETSRVLLESLKNFYREAMKQMDEYSSYLNEVQNDHVLEETPLKMDVGITVTLSTDPTKYRFALPRTAGRGGSLADRKAYRREITLGELVPGLRTLSLMNDSMDGRRLRILCEGQVLADGSGRILNKIVLKQNEKVVCRILDTDQKIIGSVEITTN